MATRGKKKPPARRRKTTVKTTVPVGALRPQPHGGALRNGGWNRGGPGRPPSELRALVRLSFEERVAVLESIADNRRAAAKDRIRAIDVLGKYGLGTIPTDDRMHPALTAAEVTSMLVMLARATRPHLPENTPEEVLVEIDNEWGAIVGKFTLPKPEPDAIRAADAEVARRRRERRRKAGRKAGAKASANGRRKADAPS